LANQWPAGCEGKKTGRALGLQVPDQLINPQVGIRVLHVTSLMPRASDKPKQIIFNFTPNQPNMKRIALVFAFVPFLISSCHFINEHRIKGNGNIKTETRAAGNFNSIDVGGNIEVYVRQDSVRSVKIEADENLMQYIIIKNDGDRLVIEPKDGSNLSGSKDIKVYVSSPVFTKLEVSGASGITSETVLSGDKIYIDVNGASKANLDLKSPSVSVDLSGASHASLRGQAKDLHIDSEGASHANAFALLSENADVDASGASSAEVFASVSIKADASGASHIRYKGGANYSGNSSGASDISKVE
jgi:hypothetical protein